MDSPNTPNSPQHSPTPEPKGHPRTYWAIALTLLGTGLPPAAIACMMLGLGYDAALATETLAQIPLQENRNDIDFTLISIGAALALLPALIVARMLQNKLTKHCVETSRCDKSLLWRGFKTGALNLWTLQLIPPFTLFAVFILSSEHPILLALTLTLISGTSCTLGMWAGHAVHRPAQLG